ncbi:MAG TPA: WD40 repeat domain-containing serine/threonine protein kinase [Dongiaceae bacterium]|nr:WD40 repeat domain-containing serine/threonine protein kinase [Dongiaceae bacterium]
MSGLCPRCLMAEGLAGDLAAAADTRGFIKPAALSSLGDYDLLREVARGGMGVVYQARQRSLNRIVAVKVLASGRFASPEYVRRFRAEAEAAARLQHPNIVAVHEVGETDGVRYFSMDFVEGPNLGQFMGGEPLTPERAARVLRTLAQAIQYAHQQGILHRDLKPANVLIDGRGEPRVTDFGLARELAKDSDLTLTGQVLGTPGFLPPEQADSNRGPLTTAADVYSLGAILYYMLTARAPFVSGSLRETLRQVLSEDPLAPSLLNPEVPRDLETICLKCLERESARRYQSAVSLEEDLRRYLEREPILARRVSALGRFSRWCRRRPALAAVWLLLVVMAIGSTFSAAWISRAERSGRERLREARLAQARALRHTTIPGRRSDALAAIAEAAQVRTGPDLRDEALAALMQPDLETLSRWDLDVGLPASVSFDPSGSIAAVQLPDATGYVEGSATLVLWGQKQPLGQLSLAGTNRIVGPLRFDANGKLVMAHCLDESLRVWRVGETAPFVVITNRPLPGGLVLTAGFNEDYDFSPDGSLFVLGLPDKGLSLHRTSDGAELGRSEGGERFSTLRFAPDGRHIAAAQTTKLRARDVFVFGLPQLTIANRFTMSESPAGLGWSADGGLLAISAGDSTVALFDLRDGRLVKNLLCPGTGQEELTFLGGDSMLALRGTATTLRFVNLASGSDELVIPGYGRSSLSARPDGESFVVTSILSVATRWRVDPPVGFRMIPAPRPAGYQAPGGGCSLDFSPDGRWAASSHGRYTLLREVASGRLADELDTGEPNGVEFGTVAFGHDGLELLRNSTRSGLQRVALEYDTNGWPHFAKPVTLDPEPGFLVTDHLADAKRLVLVDQNLGRVKLVEVGVQGAKVLSRWETPYAYTGAFSPDGDLVLVNCGGATNLPKPQLRRVLDGSLLRELPAPSSCDVAWSTQGNRALTSNGQKQSILWNTVDWKPVKTFQTPLGGDPTTFTLAPDGTYGVINRDEFIYLVSTRDGATLARLEIPGAPGNALAIRFLPDGRRFAILWSDARIHLVEPDALRRSLKPLGLDW